MKYSLLLCVISFVLPSIAYAEPLVTRASRIKVDQGRYYAVVPFYKWYLDGLNLTKDNFRTAQYPINTKFGIAEPFLMRAWEQTGKSVELSIAYQNIPSYDIIRINNIDITIKYVSDDEFIKSTPSGLKKVH